MPRIARAHVEGSGTPPPPTVADPKVTSSNTTKFATPPNPIEWAVPEKETPIGTNGQYAALYPGQALGVRLRSMVASRVPVPSRPEYTFTFPPLVFGWA